jgi:glucokinase
VPAHEEVWAVGLDVGGTKTAGGLVRFPAGEVTCRQIIPTRAERDPDVILADVSALALRLRRQVPPGRQFAGLGIGVPELVDLQGRITSGQTIDWRGSALSDQLAGVGPVCVEADVRAAARAEALFGAGRAHRVFALVTVGTGISSTLVQDARPYAGARGNALVLASGPVSMICPRCGALARTVVEEIASGPALVRRYNELHPAGAGSAEDVLAASRRGDADAIRVVREAGEALGSSVGFLVNILDPEAVVIGGGLGLAGGLYWDVFLSSVRRHIWAEASRALPVVRAELGSDAGLIGAAAAAVLATNSLPRPRAGFHSPP